MFPPPHPEERTHTYYLSKGARSTTLMVQFYHNQKGRLPRILTGKFSKAQGSNSSAFVSGQEAGAAQRRQEESPQKTWVSAFKNSITYEVACVV